jgi:hypothetical protein
VGISDQEMSHANWRLDNPPVVDVAVSRRMGLFVVGRLAARHGVRVRLRHAQAGGLTALIWLPDTVAAPEVAPPLGRLRRFEADDYGPAPSLSAPTQTTASQATAAARIPRFTPAASPSNPPAAPSFTPAAGAGTPAPPAQTPPSQAAAASIPPSQAAAASIPPAQTSQTGQGSTEPPPGAKVPGLGDGGLAAARSGWDVGGAWGDGNDDEPATQALPIRNGNPPANGNASANGAPLASAEPGSPVSPATPADPSGLPAFTGLSSQGPRAPQFPIGSQNVRGSDGPGVSDVGSAANGTLGPAGLPGGAGNGSGADDAAAAPTEQRLPIFDSLESDWFRRSGAPLTAGSRTKGVQGAQGPQGIREAQPQAAAEPSAWTSPADEGWRAAQAVAAPAAGDTTQAGLPRRVPRANLVPGSVGNGGGQGSQETETEAPVRSPDVARSRMASFQRGVREGRAAAPPQTEES